jgi:hypothetical protein
MANDEILHKLMAETKNPRKADPRLCRIEDPDCEACQ